MTGPTGATLAGDFKLRSEPLFSDLRLELLAGKWTCLLGPSGVGKSTLIRLFAGLDTGGVFDGTVQAADGGPVAGRAAYMAQTDLLAPWLSVRGNIELGARLRGERTDTARAGELIRQVGLAGFENARPHELSGGMRQRAALARTLIEDLPFVLLDEPFSALDAGNRAAMQELTFGLLQRKTVLLVTHDPAEAARMGHRVFVMDASGLSEPYDFSALPIRAFDDDETLRAQTRLLAIIRASVNFGAAAPS
ncbi:MAG: ABC transporter ATP-binding protein [Gammaproteobacteria bacterium]